MNSSCKNNAHLVMQNHTFLFHLMQMRTKNPRLNELDCMLIDI